MFKRAITGIIIFVCYAVITFSQSSLWSYYTPLVQSINSISEEGNFLWVAKNTDVVKINKTNGNIQKFTYNDFGLKSGYLSTDPDTLNRIYNMCVDKKGTVWLLLEKPWEETLTFASFKKGKLTFYNDENSPLTNFIFLYDIPEILIDSSNNKWFLTRDNLIKFDDSSWIVYDTSNSPLPGSFVDSFTLDDSGNVWIGGSSGGIAKYADTGWVVIKKSGSAVGDLVFDRNNNLFFMGGDSLINKFDGANWTSFKFPYIIAHPSAGKMVFDKSNNLWIYQWSGLFSYYTLYKFDGNSWIDCRDSVFDQPIKNIFSDNNGDIWVSTFANNQPTHLENSKLAKYNATGWDFYNVTTPALPSIYVYAICVDSKNNKWIGTDNGLAVTDEINWTVYDTTNSPMPLNAISAIAVDSNGVKWIGLTNKNPYIQMTGGALAKFDDTSWTIYDSTNSVLPNCPINCILVDTKGNIYIGTNGKGMIKFDGNKWIIYDTSNSELPSNIVKCITSDRNNNICIGTTGGGFAVYNGVNFSIYNNTNSSLPTNDVTAIAVDHDNNKWIGTTGHGITKFDGNSWTTKYSDDVSSISNLCIDNKGVFWANSYLAGALWGLMNFNGQMWTFVGNETAIKSLVIDKNNKKWLSTYTNDYSAGISVYSGIDSFVTVGINSLSEVKLNDFSLSQNYPNPFNPTTTINYSVPKTSFVTIKIYDVLGKEIATLVNAEKQSGNYNVKFNGSRLASGIYFYRMEAGDYNNTKKLILLK